VPSRRSGLARADVNGYGLGIDSCHGWIRCRTPYFVDALCLGGEGVRFNLDHSVDRCGTHVNICARRACRVVHALSALTTRCVRACPLSPRSWVVAHSRWCL
jgi:hypothetical protein